MYVYNINHGINHDMVIPSSLQFHEFSRSFHMLSSTKLSMIISEEESEAMTINNLG